MDPLGWLGRRLAGLRVWPIARRRRDDESTTVDRTADGEGSDGDEANGGPFAGSRLDRSVNAAHGQQADAGQREIERLQTDAADLEEAADESGPDRP